MVLHPIGALEPGSVSQGTGSDDAGPGVFESAWKAVERRQRAIVSEWWLITQPDHAALSAALAANFVSPRFPAVDAKLARAIEVHDAGWSMFAAEAEHGLPPLDAHGKPLSFIEIEPPDFLRAWTGSIERAEQVCPAGGYIVSRHFCALARGRLQARLDSAENASRLASFLERESARQRRLSGASGSDAQELDALLAVLQFCDLLSLFLCCGATEAVEFPQHFGGCPVRLSPRNGAFALDPSPFRRSNAADAEGGLSLGVRARRYPAHAAETSSTTLAFLLW